MSHSPSFFYKEEYTIPLVLHLASGGAGFLSLR